MPRRIVFPEPGRVALEEFSLPAIAANEVHVRTIYSLMSIGTETTILTGNYAPDSHFARMFSFPQLKTGVQAIGRVVDVGSGVGEFASGDRVYMRMAHGSEQILAADACSPVPESIDGKSACWCGLAKTAFRAAWAAPFRLGASVLIVGAGPVGQMAIRWARVAGVGELAALDLAEGRLQHAIRGGATKIICGNIEVKIDAIGEMDGGNGPAIVVDTTGNPRVFQYALAAAARFGKVILLGDTGFPGEQSLSSDVMVKGLTIQATHDSHDRDGWSQRRIDKHFFNCVADGRFNLGGLITHEFRPEDCEQAYMLAMKARADTLGILFDWNS